jgi:predicted GTPase
LIAKKDVAMTSCDAVGCTTATNAHEVLIQNGTLKLKLFDTAGLEEGPEAIVPDEEARRMLRRLLRTLTEQGDLHLIMYCVRSERVIRTLARNYELIHSQVERKVPIVLVITCLEAYKPDMEEWWRVNERAISNHGMTFAGHACITTVTMGGSHMERRAQSYDAVCKLIQQCHVSSIIAASRNKRKNVVLFGMGGAGKSSLVNLIAGKNVVKTSSDVKHCTLQWQSYSIEFDGDSYNVFDTVGLEEPQLGIPQYLDAIENAYSLIQKLESQGGIDLLLFCMRAGRLTATLRSNYRLFNEFLCEKKVPVVIAITYLENEPGEMDAWWKRNKDTFRHQEFHVAGHACITAIEGSRPDRYEQSRTTIRKLVKELTADGKNQARKGGDSLFVSFMQKLKELLLGSSNPKKIAPRLIKRCGLSPDVARQLVDRIKKDVVEAT